MFFLIPIVCISFFLFVILLLRSHLFVVDGIEGFEKGLPKFSLSLAASEFYIAYLYKYIHKHTGCSASPKLSILFSLKAQHELFMSKCHVHYTII